MFYLLNDTLKIFRCFEFQLNIGRCSPWVKEWLLLVPSLLFFFLLPKNSQRGLGELQCQSSGKGPSTSPASPLGRPLQLNSLLVVSNKLVEWCRRLREGTGRLYRGSKLGNQMLTLLQNMPLFQTICPGCLWARDNRWLLSRVQRLAGPAGGTGAFCPGWWFQPGQKALGPLYPSLSPRPSHSAHLFSCCSWLGIEEFLLISSPHLWRSLIPRPSIGAKGLGLVFLFFLGLYSSFHTLEIEKMCS